MNLASKVQKDLFDMQDMKYRDFHAKLMPTVEKERIIGVRTPQLRKYAKAFGKTEDAEEFLEILPHRYYEENNLHGFLISGMKDYYKCIEYINKFLPYIDNWATCDMTSPKVFGKHKRELLAHISEWLGSKDTYTIRFGINMLMTFYLDEDFDVSYNNMVSSVKSEEYYVKMGIAWYFATALAKRYDETIGYIEDRKLDDWTHKKTIQKAIESFRVTKEHKEYLRGLK
ncbi:MAG: DNA alkylation repair protein [Eubacteriales bacterium]|nr:DNA alkylation repair protein [Eubacteriales bacterium]